MKSVRTSSRQPIINLQEAGPGSFSRSKPKWIEALWIIIEIVVLRNPVQISSRIRAAALRLFGATVGSEVILRPGLRVKFPWLLHIGDRCWIGEDVWIHNQDTVDIESDVVISQGTFISTGSHDFKQTMDLLVDPIRIRRGAWVTSRCIVLRSVDIGENALVTPGSVVHKSLEADGVFGGNPAVRIGDRWSTSSPESR